MEATRHLSISLLGPANFCVVVKATSLIFVLGELRGDGSDSPCA